MSKYDNKTAEELVSLLTSVSDVLGEDTARSLVASGRQRAIDVLETYDRNQERQVALARSRERLRSAALG